jgi:methanogenic corrinoid protein MtbC1
MDQGHRPGKLIATPVDALAQLAPRRARPQALEEGAVETAELDELLALVKHHDASGYVQALQQRLARQGLQRFVQDIIAPLTRRVGDAWEDGYFEIFEEHLYTELSKRVLRQAIAVLPRGNASPRVLLTTVADEQHILGLLMLEALLTLEGAECIPLGTQMPLPEIARAAEAHQADIVALSFSAAFPVRQIGSLLAQLQGLLPPTVEVWAGGAGLLRAAVPEGICQLSRLDQGVQALVDWRQHHA